MRLRVYAFAILAVACIPGCKSTTGPVSGLDAGAPAITQQSPVVIGDHLGLGFRFGFELAVLGDMNTAVDEIEEGTANVRFFGPSNPLSGPVLGMSLYAYFGQ